MLNVKNVVICHCYGGDPRSNWFPWLRRELEAKGLSVRVPDFGRDERPDFDSWAAKLDEALRGFEPSETILVGHSLGAALIPRYLRTYEGEPYAASFLVAAPFDSLGWEVLEDFFEKGKLESSVKDKMGKITLIASDDDPHVPLSHVYKYREVLGGEVIVERGLSHIWQGEYERLRDLISN